MMVWYADSSQAGCMIMGLKPHLRYNLLLKQVMVLRLGAGSRERSLSSRHGSHHGSAILRNSSSQLGQNV